MPAQTPNTYPPAILDAGARALAARAGVFGDYDRLEPSYQRDLRLDAAAVLDASFAPHLAGLIADELDRRLTERLERELYPEGERRAAAVRDGFSAYCTQFGCIDPHPAERA